MTAFRALQKALIARPCLRPIDFSADFILTTDAASTKGFGAILSQLDKHGVEHPCAYASRSISLADSKKAPFQLELLALLWGMKHFKCYLVGKHFRARTDHKPLCGVNRIQGQQLERVRAELQDFLPFTLEYIKGETNPSDSLSRNPVDMVDKARLLDSPAEHEPVRHGGGAAPRLECANLTQNCPEQRSF